MISAMSPGPELPRPVEFDGSIVCGGGPLVVSCEFWFISAEYMIVRKR